MKIVDNSKLLWFFPPNIDAFVFGDTIYCRRRLPAKLYWHEMCHVLQYKKHGIMKFLYIYFIKDSNKPYREKTFEKEAYSVHNESDLLGLYPQYVLKIRTAAQLYPKYYS